MICPVVAEMVLFSDVNMNMYHLDSSEKRTHSVALFPRWLA